MVVSFFIKILPKTHSNFLGLKGIQSEGIQSGGIQSEGIQSGGIQSEGIQSGGIQSEGIQSGGIQSEGIQSGGIQRGRMCTRAAVPHPLLPIIIMRVSSCASSLSQNSQTYSHAKLSSTTVLI